MGIRGTLRQIQNELARPIRRYNTLRTWGRTDFRGVPVVFGNAMPKSGSKLLNQILAGICEIGPFLPTGRIPIRTITIDGRRRSQDEIQKDLRRLRPGDVTLGYLRASTENIAHLCRPDWAVYFIIRDPRDMLVSHLYYATEMYSGHGMHEYYNTLPDMDARLTVAIQGIQEDGLSMASVGERYERIRGWLRCPEIMTLHFEDLILKQTEALNGMLDHLEKTDFALPTGREDAVRRLSKAIDPKTSPTFRKGKVGDWQSHFKDEHKDLFKQVTGDLLVELRYEVDNNW